MNQRIKKRPRIFFNTRRVVALFGHAKLMREGDGQFWLEGGSHHDEAAAIEWASMFLPEAIVARRGDTTH